MSDSSCSALSNAEVESASDGRRVRVEQVSAAQALSLVCRPARDDALASASAWKSKSAWLRWKTGSGVRKTYMAASIPSLWLLLTRLLARQMCTSAHAATASANVSRTAALISEAGSKVENRERYMGD